MEHSEQNRERPRPIFTEPQNDDTIVSIYTIGKQTFLVSTSHSSNGILLGDALYNIALSFISAKID